MKNNRLTTTLISLGLASAWPSLANVAIDEHIVVTANRTQQEQFLQLSATQVIDQEYIALFQPQNVADLLDKVAGISVVKQGGAGQSSSVFTRGTNSGHTLVLIDGVRVGSATLGATNFAAISLAQIERIEVVKGPRAALWGSDAIGGVIQIFTKKLHSGEANVGVGIGSHGLRTANAALGLGNEQHSLSLIASVDDSDGFNAYQTTPSPYDINEPDSDGYDRVSLSVLGQSQINERLSLHLVSRLEQGGAEFDASYPDSPCWDDPTSACPSFYANEQEHENYSLRLAGQYQNAHLFSELSVAKSQDQGATFGNGIKKSASDEITTKRDQFSLLSQYSYNPNTSVTLGFDWYREKISSNTDRDLWTPGFQTWSEDSRDVSALFLQGRHQVANFLAEAALRFDDVEGIGNETTYNVSIGYQFAESWLVSLNHATGFKAPTFNDLYWPGSGNPQLKPENITSNELLLKRRYEHANVEISWFDSEIIDLIAWAPIASGSSIWQPSNINQATIQGIELSVSAETGDLSHQFAFAYLDTEDKTTGKALQRRPQLTANYDLGYHWHAITFNGGLSYRGESDDSGKAEPLPDYWLLDLSLTYQVSEAILVMAKINNLFDKNYESAANYVADGTNYLFSMSYNF